METVTVSSKYQVVIPREIRERLGIRPGQQVQVLELEGRIELVPVREPHDLRGFLADLENTFDRDPDRL